MSVRAALVQQHASPDRAANLARALAAMERARDLGAGLAVFAELALDRFFPQEERRAGAASVAEPKPRPPPPPLPPPPPPAGPRAWGLGV